jgi:hypothetical protein
MVEMKRIKHNDLTHYFIRPHEDLPAAYLTSCNKFFDELKRSSRERGRVGPKVTSSQKIKVDKQISGCSIGIYKKE